jgi:hypothetical protein
MGEMRRAITREDEERTRDRFSLYGTYVSVEPFHLFRYLDEQAFRYNNRTDKTNADRFSIALSQIAGKRLQFKELTGQVQGAF